MAASLLYRFSVNCRDWKQTTVEHQSQHIEFDLPPLDLGTTGNGIVGRQILIQTRNGILGTGIIGWN